MQVFQGFCVSSHGTIVIKVLAIVLSTWGQDWHNQKTISKLLFIKRPEQGLKTKYPKRSYLEWMIVKTPFPPWNLNYFNLKYMLQFNLAILNVFLFLIRVSFTFEFKLWYLFSSRTQWYLIDVVFLVFIFLYRKQNMRILNS